MADTDPSRQCRLLVGPAAFGAQLLLAALALGSLLYKRHVERPQRPLNIWGLDVSKQAVSMLAAHTCGLLIALVAHEAVAAGASSECGWYAIAFVFDTTVGLALTLGLHAAALAGARWYGERRRGGAYEPAPGGAPPGAAEPWHEAVLLCGNYGEPPSYRRWRLQLGEWVACVVAARVLCGALVLLLGAPLAAVAKGLDAAFGGHPTAELYAVMICCPLLLNICQVLVQDLVLRWRSAGSGGGGGGGGKEMALPEAAAPRGPALLGPADPRSAPV